MSPNFKNKFIERLSRVRSQLTAESHLIIVSKTRSIDEIMAYYELGQRDFGENKVQELLEKSELLKAHCPEIRWHMIGHLQSNKIKQLFSVPNLWAIHSVDSLELLKKLIQSESILKGPVKIFLQLKTSHEEEKYGFQDRSQIDLAIGEFKKGQSLELYGLMTMGEIRTENFEEQARRCFQDLNKLKKDLSKDFNLNLMSSMGMSQDYEFALRENSNWIRLGTMMFE